MFEELYRSRRPLASNDLTLGVYRHSREEALSMRWLESGPTRSRNLMVIDLDIPDAEWAVKELVADDIIPQPHMLTINPNSTHGQAGYFIDGAVGTEKGQAFFEAVRKGLTVAAGGDLAYGGRMMRNPLAHPHTFTEQPLMKLGDLRKFADLAPKRKRADEVALETSRDLALITGRNVALFEGVRQFAYRFFNKAKGNFDFFEETVLRYAMEMNATYDNALPHGEVKSVTKSITRWVDRHFSVEDFAAIQGHRSNRRWVKDVEARTELKEVMWSLRTEDNLTVAEIAELTGKTVGATKAALRRIRIEKEGGVM